MNLNALNAMFRKPFDFLVKILWSKTAFGIIGLLIVLFFLRKIELPESGVSAIGIPISQEWLIGGGALVIVVIALLFWKKIWILLLLGIPLVVFIAYQHWDSVEDARHETVRILKNGIAKSVFIGKVEDLPIAIDTSDFPRAYYRLEVHPDPGKESYWGDCDGGKSLRGHSVDNESTRKRVANPREGNIVVMSGRDSSRNGDLIYIREDAPLKVTLDLSGITVGKNCVINLGARLFFIPEKG